MDVYIPSGTIFRQVEKNIVPEDRAGQNLGMLDWTNAGAYPIAKDLDRNGWTWEFMRRNPDYRADFAGLKTAKSHYDPSKKDGENEQDWIRRVMASGGEPVRMTPNEQFVRKWRVIQIRDPNSAGPPDFDVFPIRPVFDEIKKYFEDDESCRQVAGFAVLVFDLGSGVAAQLDRGKAWLLAHQKSSKGKRRNIWPKHWITYLRLIDAHLVGAESPEIRAQLEEYLPESEDADHKHKAADRFADHRKAAFALRDDPLSILMQKSP
jgi:hypothetical protein